MTDEQANQPVAAAPVEPTEEVIAGEEAVLVDDERLPFPNARVVALVRKSLDKGKIIKGQVKVELNQWLGKMVERVGKKMNEYPYATVDGGMLREAIEPYENIQDIEHEKERIIKQLESIKAACDVLINEVDRKFVK